MDVADPRDARGCLPSISSREASTEPKPLYPVSGEGGGVFTEMSVSPQTSPLSARHIAGVTLAQNSGVECARGRYLWDFTLFTSPISRHPKSAYASQGL